MKQRERILGMAVVLLLVALVGSYFVKGTAKWFTTKNTAIEDLEEEVARKQRRINRGRIARKQLTVYENRSLAGNLAVASRQYRAWLGEWGKNAGIAMPRVQDMGRPRRMPGSYEQNKFSVTFEATLPQLTQLLYDFYRADFLHRIENMTIKRGLDDKLTLTFTFVTLSLPGVEAEKPLIETPSERLAWSNLDDYMEVIVYRNSFAPANNPPRFASDRTTKSAYRGRRAQFDLGARDPDGDSLKYRLEGELANVAFIDSSGRFSYTPRETGTFKVTVIAEDQGIPARQARQEVEIFVTEPPPERAATPRPVFDMTKYTYLTGIVEVNGQREAWLYNRPMGKSLHLTQGEEFSIGPFSGTMTEIHDDQVHITSGDSVMLVRRGQNLAEGKILSQAQNPPKVD